MALDRARIDLALRAWPAVADSGWTALGEGQLSQAVLVAPDVVVRFPRHALGSAHLRTEQLVVPVLEPYTDVAPPHAPARRAGPQQRARRRRPSVRPRHRARA